MSKPLPSADKEPTAWGMGHAAQRVLVAFIVQFVEGKATSARNENSEAISTAARILVWCIAGMRHIGRRSHPGVHAAGRFDHGVLSPNALCACSGR